LDLTLEFLDKKISEAEKTKLARVVKFAKERSEILGELAKSLEIYLDNFSSEFDEESKKIII
jgi:hypothetical protein